MPTGVVWVNVEMINIIYSNSRHEQQRREQQRDGRDDRREHDQVRASVQLVGTEGIEQRAHRLDADRRHLIAVIV